jgi:hypothetical protein
VLLCCCTVVLLYCCAVALLCCCTVVCCIDCKPFYFVHKIGEMNCDFHWQVINKNSCLCEECFFKRNVVRNFIKIRQTVSRCC